MPHFADCLLAAIEQKGSPICVGLDPVYERLPSVLREEYGGDLGVKDDVPPRVEAIEAFCSGVIWAVAEHVPAVKLQSACFERYHGPGMAAFFRVVDEAKRNGLIVIADAKRGDIGTSSDHYAATFFEHPDGEQEQQSPDALTVNGYLGIDGIQPFIDVATKKDAGLFVLVRTSNPGGDALQSLGLTDGRTVAEAVADLVRQAGEQHVGERGYSHVGAVVGATKPQDAARLRERMPEQLFLVPGFGAQGGSAEDVRACFKPDGSGAIITASRSVIYAFEKANEKDEDWTKAVGAAAAKMKRDVAAMVGK